jgi:hypothetical protein
VNSSVEYNALCLAAHKYSMGPHAFPELCLPRKHNLVILFKLNFMLFSKSRHVTSKFSKRILRSDLGDLSLRSLAKLRTKLEACYSKFSALHSLLSALRSHILSFMFGLGG